MKTKEDLEKLQAGDLYLTETVSRLMSEISERDTLIKSYEYQAIRSIKNSDDLMDIISERDKALEEQKEIYKLENSKLQSQLLNQSKDVEFNELKKLLEDYRKENALNIDRRNELEKRNAELEADLQALKKHGII